MQHYVTLDPLVNGQYEVKCLCGNLNKKYESRNTARSYAHMHLAGFDVDLFELASAGKEDHD